MTEKEPMQVREIYDENEDFFFYLDNNGNWGSIKKALVNEMKYIKKNSLLDEWIKKKFKRKNVSP